MGLTLVFMGTPEFGVPTLEYLARTEHNLAAVIAAPDKPQGRGYVLLPSAVKKAALRLGLPVWQPANVNDPEFLLKLAQARPDVLIVAAFGQILKKSLLELPARGCLNVHASLLPRYRGAAPIQWAIARGETVTGVTVQRMAERLDSGDIWVQKSLEIGPDETASELAGRLALLGGPAVVETLEQMQSAGAQGRPQSESEVTWAPSLTRDDGRLDWAWPSEDIHNRVRAFNPWPGTFTQAGEVRLKVLATRRAETSDPAVAEPGTILQVDARQGWLVAAGARTRIWVQRVQAAGKPAVAAAAYTCGHRFGPGSRLG